MTSESISSVQYNIIVTRVRINVMCGEAALTSRSLNDSTTLHVSCQGCQIGARVPRPIWQPLQLGLPDWAGET